MLPQQPQQQPQQQPSLFKPSVVSQVARAMGGHAAIQANNRDRFLPPPQQAQQPAQPMPQPMAQQKVAHVIEKLGFLSGLFGGATSALMGQQSHLVRPGQNEADVLQRANDAANPGVSHLETTHQMIPNQPSPQGAPASQMQSYSATMTPAPTAPPKPVVPPPVQPAQVNKAPQLRGGFFNQQSKSPFAGWKKQMGRPAPTNTAANNFRSMMGKMGFADPLQQLGQTLNPGQTDIAGPAPQNAQPMPIPGLGTQPPRQFNVPPQGFGVPGLGAPAPAPRPAASPVRTRPQTGPFVPWKKQMNPMRKAGAVRALGDPLPKDWNGTFSLGNKANGGVRTDGQEAWNSTNAYFPKDAKLGNLRSVGRVKNAANVLRMIATGKAPR
jgi:hypothetical protein